jgi:CheY-like chemotaxis protein
VVDCAVMGRPLRLLLVEDHQDSAELMAEILASHGHQVAVAATASEALELARTQVFDLVVSDVGLPDASGYDLMRQLSALQTLKGIAITGSTGAEVERAGRAAGFSAHLTKPVTMRRLEQVIAEVCV